MSRMFAALLLLPLALSGCAKMYGVDMEQPQVEQPAPVAKPMPAPKPFDPLVALNAVPGVTVYPLNTPPSDPFTRKNLQPLSSKVIGEGYFVEDPSVNVYPPRLPQAVPAVTPMDSGVRVDAASALYSGKIRAQEPPKTVLVPSAPAGQPVDDMSGGVIAQQALPPVIGDNQTQVGNAPQPEWGGMGGSTLPPVQEKFVTTPAPMMAAPAMQGGWGSQPTLMAPPQHAFTQAGAKSGPVQTGYGAPPPVAQPKQEPIVHTPPSQGPGMQPPTSFDLPGTPAPSLPASPQGQVGQSSLPSLTGY